MAKKKEEKKEITAMASAYSGLDDSEFLGYDAEAKKSWDAVAAKQAKQAELKKLIDTLMRQGYLEDRAEDVSNINKAIVLYGAQLDRVNKDLTRLQGEAQVFETKRENRGAALKQGGENEQAGTAGGEAVENENLLARNINQEITGRIARNTEQAREAMAGVNLLSDAERGRVAARAGQAGYDVSSGTAGAMADAARSRSEADQAAIEGYRVGRQNLLMGQGNASTKAAESLTGTINQQTSDWTDKSVSAVDEVTGNLLTNVEQLTKTKGFSGDAQTPGVKASQAAVGSTLDTWSFESYMDVLDTLTSRSANKGTWDQMLLDQAGTPTNPYGQFDTALSPLTPVAGAQSNLLAAGAGADNLDNVYTLSGAKNKTGRLI